MTLTALPLVLEYYALLPVAQCPASPPVHLECATNSLAVIGVELRGGNRIDLC